ncbi:MAG: glycosyltransferase family 39 protein [Chloroflexia bacterium]
MKVGGDLQAPGRENSTPIVIAAPREGAWARARATAQASPVARAVWRYRAFVFGLAAFALAVVGEQLMRTPIKGVPVDPALGAALVQVAALLVGLVSWVRDGYFAPRRVEAGAGGEQAAPLPARRAAGGRVAARPASRTAGARARGLMERYRATRARLGWVGTVVGLLVVLNLGIWCYLLLEKNFRDPLALLVWVAGLVALALTFVGVRPNPAGGLLAHDPAEPVEEPRVSRAEWMALGVILLVALALRVWNLENIPAGPYIDESDRAIIARDILRGQPTELGPVAFFGSDWWGVPSAYFYLVAASLRLFGDSLAGARAVHVLAGVLTIWFAYRLGRAIWSPRAGLLAAALLTVSDFAIQFSRTAGESTITILAWTVCFYYLYRGLKSTRPLDFVLAGIAGGLTLYGYAAGKLLPPVLVLVALYLLARWGVTGIKRYLPGLALTALAMFVTFAPHGYYLLSHPDVLTERYKGVSIFNHQNEAFAQYRADNWPAVLGKQLELTYGAFDVGSERGPFYPTGQPLLPVPWAALWVLGTAYAVWRVGDARYALLCAWLLGGLAGAALTNETPAVQRVAVMVPLLGLVPALFADRVVGDLPARLPTRARWRSRALRLATSAALLAMALMLALQTIPYYFGPYTAAAHYEEFTLTGRFAEKLDPQHDVVYQSGIPALLGSPSPTVFLAKDVALKTAENLSDMLPLTDNEEKNAHFVFFPYDDPAIDLVRSLYPGSTRTALSRSDGQQFATALSLSEEQIDAQRMVTATYGAPAGPIYERMEPRLGTVTSQAEPGKITSDTVAAPVWMTYPLNVEWSGGLVVPDYGGYRFNVTTPSGATLDIDGRRVLTDTAGSGQPAEVSLVLARGVHQVRLAGRLESQDGQVELRWSTDEGVPEPVARRFLWGGPPGVLSGRYYLKSDIPGLITNARPDVGKATPYMERRDEMLSWHSINSDLPDNGTLEAVWTGTLVAPSDGSYSFNADTDSAASIWIDGHMVGGRRVAGSGPELPATVDLTHGEHSFEVRYEVMRDDDRFAVYWVPPGAAEPALLPAQAFKPLPNGVWTKEERPNAPTVPPEAVNVGGGKLALKVARVIDGSQQYWNQARGVGVLADGSVVVGNTGSSEIVLLNPAGTEVGRWGKQGSGDGKFGLLSDVAVSQDGIIAALDAQNNDIQLFTAAGNEALHISNSLVDIAHASGIAWGRDGKLYVADTATNRVLRLDRSGQIEKSFGAGNANHRSLEQPTDVAAAADGTVWALDLRGRVVRFTPDGGIDAEYTVPVGTTQGGSHLEIWGETLAVTNPDQGTINFVDMKTGVVRAAKTTDNKPLGLNTPIGVAVGADGQLYIMDSGNNRVVVLGRQ